MPCCVNATSSPTRSGADADFPRAGDGPPVNSGEPLPEVDASLFEEISPIQ
jgi:hypothetical protein